MSHLAKCNGNFPSLVCGFVHVAANGYFKFPYTAILQEYYYYHETLQLV